MAEDRCGPASSATNVRIEHSTFRWLLEPMLAAAGFEILTADFEGSVDGRLHLPQALSRPQDCAAA